MQPGRLDRKVTILRRTLTRNDLGEQVETFAPHASVWAQKLDVTGRELFTAKETIAENSARFRLRYRDDLLATDRIRYEDREYDITQIAELGRREGLDILAVARVP